MMISRSIGELPTAEQFEQIEHRASASAARETAAAKISPAKRLQNALRALGVAQGDPALSKLSVDGVIGPGTLKATNYALSTYVGGGQHTLTQVRQNAAALADQVTHFVESHGGVVLPPSAPVKKIRMTLPALTIPSPGAMPQSGSFDTKYVWWGVAALSGLVILSMFASVTRRRRPAAEAT